MKKMVVVVVFLISLIIIDGAQNGEVLKKKTVSAEFHENYTYAAKLFEQAYLAYKAQNGADVVCAFRTAMNDIQIN